MPSNVVSMLDYRIKRQEDTREYLEQAALFVAIEMAEHQEIIERGNTIISIIDELLCKPHIISDERKRLIEAKLLEIFGRRFTNRSSKECQEQSTTD